MKRAEQLKSIKMPKQKMAEDEAAMDLDMLGSEEEMPAEGPEGEESAIEDAGEMKPEAPGEMLADVSDEDLLMELKKRGLIEGEEGSEAPGKEEAPEME